jgi:tetratricopeptide (TPR) repeat protein
MPRRPRKPRRRRTAQERGPGSQDRRATKPRLPRPLGRRVWLFRLAALILGPILFLVLLELGLRTIGYGYNPDTVVECERNGTAHFGDNVKFAWRFFPPLLAREFEPFVFPAEKPANTYRIFVLGASAAQGAPNNAFRFGRILEFMLRGRFPDVDFEVVTAAMAAINSHVVVEIAGDCARHDPDLFVVYLGNNEVVGPYGPGTVLTPMLSNLRLIRLGIAFRATKIGQLLSAVLGGHGLRKQGPQYWQGMEMFLGQQVRADDPRLETTYSHFRRNLEDICRTAAETGAETVLCTVGSNLRDCPPFASLNRLELSPEQQRDWDAAYRQGMVSELQDKYAEAITSYLKAAVTDDSYAELQFRLGRCYQFLGEHGNARDRYIQARDLDTLRFRADTRTNEAVRAVADRMQSQRVYLADVAKALDANSPHDLPGEELFHEHVHLTFEGNYAVARAVLEQVESRVAKRFGDKVQARGALPTQQQCAERLGYNDWSRQETLHKVVHSFLAKPPFTNQLYHEEQVEQLKQQLQSLEASLTPDVLTTIGQEYVATIEKAPGDWRLRWDYGQMLAEDLKQYDAAAEQYRIVQQLLPHSHMGHDALASVLRAKGDLNGAIAEYQKELAIKPTAGKAYYYAGWCYHRQGRTDVAIEHYRQAIRFEPDCVPAYLDLGELLYKQGHLDRAAEACRQGLAVTPNHPLLHSNLGMLLIKMGKQQEGTEEIRKALQLDPDSPQIRRVAETLLGPGAAR